MGLSWRDLDPTQATRSVTNTVKSYMRSPAQMFRNPIKIFDPAKIINTGQIEKDWRNAGRGEIGKIVGGVGQSAYNVAVAPTRAVVTGNYGKEAQRAVGGVSNMMSFGASDYLGGSKDAQNFLRSDTTKKYTLGASENYAGLTRGTRTAGRDGVLDNDDRNNIIQGGVKVAAVATGIGAYNYLTAPAAAAPAAASTSAPSGAYGMYAVAGDGTASQVASAASGGASVGSWLQNAGYVAIGAQVLSGKKSADQALYEIGSGQAGDQKWWDAVRDIVGDGTGSNPSPTLDYSGYSGGGMKSLVSPGMIGDVMPLIMISGLAIGAYFLFFKKKRIFA